MAGDRRHLDATGLVSARVAILGMGRVGTVLARALPDAVRVGRGARLPEADITWVCVAEDDLAAAWFSIPERAREGAVLVQNGLLAPWLTRHAPGATHGVLYFAAPTRDGIATGSGTSLFHGPLADHAVSALTGVGLPARVSASVDDHARACAYKLAWTCAMGVLCARGARTVGEVLRDDAPALAELVAEMAPVLSFAYGVDVEPDALLASVTSYSAEVAAWRASIKALSWRNGALCAAAARARLRMPLHRRLLEQAGIDVGAASRGASALLYSNA